MKVLFSHDIFVMQPHGGASRVFAGLHRALRAQGVDSRVCGGLHINGYLAGQARSTGIHLRTAATPAIQRAFGLCNAPLERAMVAAWRPSVYHLTYFPRRTSPAPAPVVITVLDMIHELYAEQFPEGDPTSARKRHWANAADLVLTISQRTKDDLVSLFSIPEEKVVVVYPGVEAPVPDPSFDVRPYGDYLLFVGEREMGYKNFYGLARAVARSEVARSLNLVCFGGRAAFPSERDLLTTLGLVGQTFYVNGSDPQLAALYVGARALVYPSRYEGFGFPPLEAMASGCAVACSRAASIPEVVGDAALLFDPDDVDDMAAALDRVVSDEAIRARLVDSGRRRAGEFNWERAANDAVQAYRLVATGVESPVDGAPT